MSNIHPTSRPLAVKFALALFAANQATILVPDAIRGHWHSLIFYISFGTMLAMLFVPPWFVFRGKNWARWLMVAFWFAGFFRFYPGSSSSRRHRRLHG
jgi:hypothetical protein